MRTYFFATASPVQAITHTCFCFVLFLCFLCFVQKEREGDPEIYVLSMSDKCFYASCVSQIRTLQQNVSAPCNCSRSYRVHPPGGERLTEIANENDISLVQCSTAIAYSESDHSFFFACVSRHSLDGPRRSRGLDHHKI